ncbi:MAG: hypothetical protein ACKVZJ_09565 [Phycisphaerales bacterium]
MALAGSATTAGNKFVAGESCRRLIVWTAQADYGVVECTIRVSPFHKATEIASLTGNGAGPMTFEFGDGVHAITQLEVIAIGGGCTIYWMSA